MPTIERKMSYTSGIVSNKDVIEWYESRLKYFKKVGIGGETEYGKVSPRLVRVTQRRLDGLKKRQLVPK